MTVSYAGTQWGRSVLWLLVMLTPDGTGQPYDCKLSWHPMGQVNLMTECYAGTQRGKSALYGSEYDNTSPFYHIH